MEGSSRWLWYSCTSDGYTFIIDPYKIENSCDRPQESVRPKLTHSHERFHRNRNTQEMCIGHYFENISGGRSMIQEVILGLLDNGSVYLEVAFRDEQVSSLERTLNAKGITKFNFCIDDCSTTKVWIQPEMPKTNVQMMMKHLISIGLLDYNVNELQVADPNAVFDRYSEIEPEEHNSDWYLSNLTEFAPRVPFRYIAQEIAQTGTWK